MRKYETFPCAGVGTAHWPEDDHETTVCTLVVPFITDPLPQQDVLQAWSLSAHLIACPIAGCRTGCRLKYA